MPVVDERQGFDVPAHPVAIGKLPGRACRLAVATVPIETLAGVIDHGVVVAHAVAQKHVGRAIPVAVQLHAVGAIATIPAVPPKFGTHEVRGEREAVVAHAIAHPRSGVAIAVAVLHFARGALRKPHGCAPRTEDPGEHSLFHGSESTRRQVRSVDSMGEKRRKRGDWGGGGGYFCPENATTFASPSTHFHLILSLYGLFQRLRDLQQ